MSIKVIDVGNGETLHNNSLYCHSGIKKSFTWKIIRELFQEIGNRRTKRTPAIGLHPRASRGKKAFAVEIFLNRY